MAFDVRPGTITGQTRAVKGLVFLFCFFYKNKKPKNLKFCFFLFFFTNFKIINAKNVVSSTLWEIVVWCLLTSLMTFYGSTVLVNFIYMHLINLNSIMSFLRVL